MSVKYGADLPEILADFLNGVRPISEVSEIFEDISGNDIGDFDVKLKDGRLFRAYFEEVTDDE